MTTTTIFLGKLLGFYLIAISLAMLARRRSTLEVLDDMASNGAWMLFSGMVATAIGIAIVLGHNAWTDGALAIAVTLFGWAALLKGLSLLIIPTEIMAKTYRSMGFERYFYLWMGVVFVLGLWMTLAAFGARGI